MKYKLFGRSGLRVSELCLGTMTFGEEWGYGANKDESEKIFRTYIDSGGNFIDTANRYTDGTSEKYIGGFIKNGNIRNEVILATKYSLVTDLKGGINDSGNHRKNLIQSLDASLRRLQTDYVDLFYLHAWDYTTHIEEIMRALDDVVSQGKVLYVAISDTPAWIVSRANAIADLRGWSPFVALQIEYSLIQRTVERELIPMAKSLDLGVVAWAPIGGGALTGKYLQQNENPKRLKKGSTRLSERNLKIAQEVVDIANEFHCSPSQVAIAWVRQQGEVIIPIVGSRNAEQLNDNLQSINITLDNDNLQRLNEISKVEPGFPHDFLSGEGVRQIMYGGKYNELEKHRVGF